MADPGRPVGTVTRGTTNPNRLRRIDRWLAGPAAAALRRADDPLVVDLGYGASAVTTLELADRLARVRADVDVVGLEIDPERVRTGTSSLSGRPPGAPSVRFARGGFELGAVDGRRPVLVRAANVLRQYDVGEVASAWDEVTHASRARRAARRRDVRRARPQGGLGHGRTRRTRVADPVAAAARPGASVGRGREAAEGADPPQRAGRARPRLVASARRRLGAIGPPGVFRCATTVPGDVSRGA